MRPLGDIARRTGRTAALSVFALIFFLSAVTLLTLAAFFLLVPFYGPGQTLLILGIVHLAISLIFAGLMMLGRHRPAARPTAAAAPPPFEGSVATGLATAFFAGLSQGVATGSQRRPHH